MDTYCKYSHLTWTTLLHYPVKVEDSKKQLILKTSTLNCCCVPVNKLSQLWQT